MLQWGIGHVIEIKHQQADKQILRIETMENKIREAINYPYLTGNCKVGDNVVLNISAVELNLGTGGYDFIIANLTSLPLNRPLPQGHIMKNRYTPLQIPIQAGEEENHLRHPPHFDSLQSLQGTPVLIISLHSMLPLLILKIKNLKPASKIVYVMTDSTALPIWLSHHVTILLSEKLIEGTITSGQAFGGHIEAINKYSALLLAKYSLHADFIIIGPGPGSVGTNSKWGYSSIEVGEIINAVNTLKGKAVVAPRLSFQDNRKRHYGLSHHLLTSLETIALTTAHLPLPDFRDWRSEYLREQIVRIIDQHHIHWHAPVDPKKIKSLCHNYPIPIRTMGRGVTEDAEFFQGIIGAADYSASLTSC